MEEQKCPGCGCECENGTFCRETCARDFHFDRLIVCAEYRSNPLIKKAISTFKYRFCRELTAVLGEIMKRQLEDTLFLDPGLNASLLIPIPIHKKRLKFRGFNQTRVLADYLRANVDGLRVIDCLRRDSFKVEQAKLSKSERLKNLDGAISVDEDCMSQIQNRSVILIDDVATTGSTLNECAKALKSCGVSEVSSLVLARG